MFEKGAGRIDIIGIGTDLIEIERIGAALRKNDAFAGRVFGPSELKWLEEKGFKAESAAANFAGKEAVLKVFGTGLRDCKLCEIQILRDALGKPFVLLDGGAKELAKRLGIDEIQISLSHSKKCALAYAIGTRRE